MVEVPNNQLLDNINNVAAEADRSLQDTMTLVKIPMETPIMGLIVFGTLPTRCSAGIMNRGALVTMVRHLVRVIRTTIITPINNNNKVSTSLTTASISL